MATEPENQPNVKSISQARPWKKGNLDGRQTGSRVIACFGEPTVHPYELYTIMNHTQAIIHGSPIDIPSTLSRQARRSTTPRSSSLPTPPLLHRRPLKASC